MKINLIEIDLTDVLYDILVSQGYELIARKKKITPPPDTGFNHSTLDKILDKDKLKWGFEEKEPEKEKPVYLANEPTVKQRMYSILNHMPEHFDSHDFVDYWSKQGYEPKRMMKLFSFASSKLKKTGKIKVINPEANPIKRKYEVINRDIKDIKTLNALKEGAKVLMGTIQ